MLRIAIIEDITVFRNELKEALIRCFGKREIPRIDFYEDGETFLAASYNGQPYDALFFDIVLPGISGMEAAKAVRVNGYAGIIIFTTSHEQFVYEGYEAEAFRYLLKPVNDSDIEICVKRILHNQEKNSLVYSFGKKQYSIDYDEISYISSYGHYITFHTSQENYEWKHSLKELEPVLPEQFVRCHRSFIVNLDYLRKIEGRKIVLKDNTVIDVASGYLECVRKTLIQSI